MQNCCHELGEYSQKADWYWCFHWSVISSLEFQSHRYVLGKTGIKCDTKHVTCHKWLHNIFGMRHKLQRSDPDVEVGHLDMRQHQHRGSTHVHCSPLPKGSPFILDDSAPYSLCSKFTADAEINVNVYRVGNYYPSKRGLSLSLKISLFIHNYIIFHCSYFQISVTQCMHSRKDCLKM